MPLILGTNSIKDTGFDVANSLRFDSASDENLSRTPSSASNRKTFTISAWVKKAKLGNTQTIIDARIDSNDNCSIFFNSDDNIFIKFKVSPTSQNTSLTTNRKFRDVSAWYHIVLAVDMTQGTDTNRVKLYVNGVQETSFSSATYLAQNTDTTYNNTNEHQLGSRVADTSQDLDGYMAEFVMVDGQALDPTSFGEFDEDSVIWKPKDVSGLTFGTNGFYLDFENSGSLGADVSGNGNNFTVNNLTSVDQSTDTCTNNFCTMNPLMKNPSATNTFSEGNLVVTIDQTDACIGSTIGVNSGKWYWEQKWTQQGANDRWGVVPDDAVMSNHPRTTGIGWDTSSSQFYLLGSAVSGTWGGSIGTSDIIQIALDLDNSALYLGVNGTYRNSGNPTSASSRTGAVDFSSSSLVGKFLLAGFGKGNQDNSTMQYNFGSPPYSESGGNSDGNGYGNFNQAVPSGYYALNTKNLAEYG